jgi:hypothetical protein
MIEAGVSERVQQLVGDADSRGNEIGVEAGRTGAGSDLHEVAPRAGSPPDRCTCSTPIAAASCITRTHVAVSSSPLARVERERVGAIGASERTAMRQLGEQAERRIQGS